jgi:hypothetical protein
MKTVKLSYSILHAWEQKRFEDAIGMYLGKELPENPYLELGKLKHKQWADWTQATGTIHPELGTEKLVKPIVEQKYEKLIPFSDDIQILIRGIIDMEDGDWITDYKCGIGTPSSYIEAWQLDLYKLLRPHATIGQYICFDPYREVVARGIKYLHDSNAEYALEQIITHGGEMINYLEINKLLKDYTNAVQRPSERTRKAKA